MRTIGGAAPRPSRKAVPKDVQVAVFRRDGWLCRWWVVWTAGGLLAGDHVLHGLFVQALGPGHLVNGVELPLTGGLTGGRGSVGRGAGRGGGTGVALVGTDASG
jgi:hypothetical protein